MAIRHKRKSTTGYTWLNTDLVDGQLGINTADGSLHVLKTDNTVQTLEPFTTDLSSSIQTTDATLANVQTVALAAGEQKIIRARVRGFESATNDTFWKEMTFGVKNVGGTVSLVGSIGSTFGYDTGASTWTVMAAGGVGVAKIQVTGEAAHTIDWTSTIEVS